MASLEVRAARKTFDGKPVLDGVSFSARDGEFVTLLGSSGCGKTTMLRVVAGLESADSGQVLIDGKDATALPPKDRDVAMVFQSYALYPHLTVRDNAALGLKLRGLPKAEIDARIADAARMLEIEPLLARRPAALSGGQRQRAALLRCLVRRPKLFLLDEPLSNLDAALRDRTRGELKLLFKRVKGTVLYVTHDQTEAMTLSDRVVLLDRGRVVQDAAPRDLYRRPTTAFAASFLGAMNLFDAAPAVELGLAAKPDRPALLGVRAEDLRVSPDPGDGLVQAAVTLAEPLGATTMLTLDFGGLSLRASVPGSWDASRTVAYAGLPSDALHAFDPATGARL